MAAVNDSLYAATTCGSVIVLTNCCHVRWVVFSPSPASGISTSRLM
jgi:hypothetical protein